MRNARGTASSRSSRRDTRPTREGQQNVRGGRQRTPRGAQRTMGALRGRRGAPLPDSCIYYESTADESQWRTHPIQITALYGKEANLSHLREIGCKAFLRKDLPDGDQGGYLNPAADKGIFIGYYVIIHIRLRPW